MKEKLQLQQAHGIVIMGFVLSIQRNNLEGNSLKHSEISSTMCFPLVI